MKLVKCCSLASRPFQNIFHRHTATTYNKQMSRQKALSHLSADLAVNLEEEEVCQRVVRCIHDTLLFPYVGLLLLDEKTGELVLTAAVGWEMEPGSFQLPLREDLNEGALLDGKLHHTPNIIRISPYVPVPEVYGSEVVVPIWIDEKVIGVLVVVTEQSGGFNQENIDVLTAIAQQTGTAIHNTRLTKSIQQAHHTAEILRTAHVALSQSLDMNVLCKTLLDAFYQLIPYDSATILLLEDQTKLRARAVRGYDQFGFDTNDALMVVFEFQPGTILHTIISTRKGTILPDVREFPHWEILPTSKHILSFLGVPMLAGGKVIGVCCLDSATTNTFTSEHVQLAEALATQAAFAIENAYLFDELTNAKHVAEIANESKSSVVANVSHELRTPLTSILGFAKVLKRRFTNRLLPQIDLSVRKNQRDSNNTKRELDIIISEGERLTALINDFLDLSKIEAGKLEWHMQPLVISEVIDRALTSTSPLFEQKGLDLIKNIKTDLPEVIGDQDRLVQVMINLLSNAVKFTEQGAVTCRAVRVDDDVLISISDTGSGIAKEEHTRIFEKFTQVTDTLTSKPAGTGLGLPICKHIVEYHGGCIWIESEPGHGSTFSFTLPVHNE